MKELSYSVVSTVERYPEAAEVVVRAGDCAIVERAGTQRQLVIRCPDGCGEVLSINLDPRSGPAWRLYKRAGRWSLYPSIDRTSGCMSHFILWNGRICWADAYDSAEEDAPDRLSPPVLALLNGRVSASYVQLADEIGELPWDVLAACRALARKDVLVEGSGKQRGIFSVKPAGLPNISA